MSTVKYLIGCPGWNEPANVDLTVSRGLVTLHDMQKGRLIINVVDIIDVTYSYENKTSASRTATGALIGDALGGELGMLGGAAVGGRKKNQSTINIKYNDNGVIRQIVLLTKEHTNAAYNSIIDQMQYARDYPQEASPVKTHIEGLTAKEEKTNMIISIISFAIVFAIFVWIFVECNK